MSRGIHTRPAARWTALIATLLATAALLLPGSPAAAHDELLGSDPAEDSTVGTLPDELTLTFSGRIATDPGASEVEVTDASGASLVDADPVAEDNTLTQALTGEASGAVTVLWKVVSSDGHPISGEFTFEVSGSGGEPSATATTEPEPSGSPEPTAPPADEASSFDDVWPWVLGGLLLAAVGGGLVALFTVRARRERTPGGEPQPGSAPGDEH
ncbi:MULTISPECIES: copper resistance CopC family protein [Microbacterium]|uniref:copper resistance CopC family protein n=1 Tax=Microbacterium TaxID=33882 RepID=UPI00146E827E|nr:MULTISPECIES: copper resistance CopC family protein [Microbacterium]